MTPSITSKRSIRIILASKAGLDVFMVWRPNTLLPAQGGLENLSKQHIAFLMLDGCKILLLYQSTIFETRAKNYEKPAPGDAIVVELDEMWHYLNLKKQTLDMESLL